MKKTILFIVAILPTLITFSSCDGGEDPPVSILGDWHVTERTLTTGNEDLDFLINSLYILETKEYDIVHRFTESGITTTYTNRETGIMERQKEGTYMLESDGRLIIDDEAYGRSISTYILSNTRLTYTRDVTINDIRDIADELGIDIDVLPAEANGVLKIHEAR